jgi:RNA polymerase sigma-70 factor (ECF subfamily)
MTSSATDIELLDRLRRGDDAAFAELVTTYQPRMLRLARGFVPSQAVAEEVVQDTWLAVVRGLERFEGRSSLATWLFAILVNRAKTAGVRENRHQPLPPDEIADPPGRFDATGAWATPPESWSEAAEDRLDAAQLAAKARAHLDTLPPAQRRVVLLRDVEGLPSAEVCRVLDISEANQRVLLHRGRSRVRAALGAEVMDR